MRKIFKVILAAGCLVGLSQTVMAQNSITIKGTVKFIDPDFKMQVFQREGFNKKILAETTVNSDHTYELKVDVPLPGVAEVNCGNWQSVRVWLEDENLGVDFRGVDTAKIKIKNPPYVYINGGKNNELMNLVNFAGYRHYQEMIAVSQAAYRAPITDEKGKQDLTMKLYQANDENYRAYMRYYAEHYADRNSVMAVIESLNPASNEALINTALDKVEKLSPVSKTLVNNYRKAMAEKREREERMKVGNPAPQFTCYSPKGKEITPADFKGKVLLIDFWASWCGPCRAETPNLKKVYEEMKGKDVEFLSVSIDENMDAWKKAMKEDGASWPQACTKDVGKGVMDLYQFSGIPFILVIDKNGNIYRKSVRGVETIREAINDALSGKPAEEPKKMAIGAAMM